MSGRGEGNGADSFRGWIRGVLVVVVIAGALGIFTSKAQFRMPRLSALQIAGIAVMAAGLAASVLASRLSGLFGESRRARALVAIKLMGVTICAVGAMLVFIQ
ncbi:MAG: hypothetical protein IJ124_09010 [Clostridia bacterium]|nr:hypothetical protein [Clostridia bacterium]